ncbi:MAG: AMP-binding protein [Chloroflexota bacterium]|nr:AMP-binding protein [Chloroflexota bacterium]
MDTISSPDDTDRIAWTPDERTLERSRLRRLIERTGAGSYAGLLERAARNPEWYWLRVLDDLDLEWHRPYDRVWDLSRGKAWPDWFPGAGFNYVSSALDRHAVGPGADRTAIIWEGDDESARELTFAELSSMTNEVANALGKLGIRRGDRVGILLPMLPETVAVTLACGKIGAVFVPLFSGYGEEAIVTRLKDCDARLLVTADGFFRRGKEVPLKDVADRAMARLPRMEKCLVIERTATPCGWHAERDRWWHDIVPDYGPVVETVATAADDPYMILYTSGTTGQPKGSVHIHAGFPIKATHDLAYCFDVQEDDTVFWLTDLGWMMGPWLIAGALTLGAAIVLLEGTPDYPGPDRLWRMVERHRITTLGLAPTAIRALMPHGEAIVEATNRISLRALGSTGETWNPDPWRWFFEVVGEGRCPIINYSGGTETSGGIVSGFTILPMKPCSFAGPVPGMVADVVDEAGASLRNGVGELVLREPWVGMTNGIWKDPDRYKKTYWSRFPDTWVHGDFAEIDEDGFWYIRGRSDDTLNVAGKRIGPAELESAAVAHSGVREAAAIGVPHPTKGDSAIVFVVPAGAERLGEGVEDEIRRAIGERLGAALRPERVVIVSDLPKTRNAKIMRRVIRAAWLGLQQGEMSALENPPAEADIRRLGAIDRDGFLVSGE